MVLFYQRDMEFSIMYSSQSLCIVYGAEDDDDNIVDDAKTNESREIFKHAKNCARIMGSMVPMAVAWNGQLAKHFNVPILACVCAEVQE